MFVQIVPSRTLTLSLYVWSFLHWWCEISGDPNSPSVQQLPQQLYDIYDTRWGFGLILLDTFLLGLYLSRICVGVPVERFLKLRTALTDLEVRGKEDLKRISTYVQDIEATVVDRGATTTSTVGNSTDNAGEYMEFDDEDDCLVLRNAGRPRARSWNEEGKNTKTLVRRSFEGLSYPVVFLLEAVVDPAMRMILRADNAHHFSQGGYFTREPANIEMGPIFAEEEEPKRRAGVVPPNGNQNVGFTDNDMRIVEVFAGGSLKDRSGSRSPTGGGGTAASSGGRLFLSKPTSSYSPEQARHFLRQRVAALNRWNRGPGLFLALYFLLCPFTALLGFLLDSWVRFFWIMVARELFSVAALFILLAAMWPGGRFRRSYLPSLEVATLIAPRSLHISGRYKSLHTSNASGGGSSYSQIDEDGVYSSSSSGAAAGGAYGTHAHAVFGGRDVMQYLG